MIVHVASAAEAVECKASASQSISYLLTIAGMLESDLNWVNKVSGKILMVTYSDSIDSNKGEKSVHFLQTVIYWAVGHPVGTLLFNQGHILSL